MRNIVFSSKFVSLLTGGTLCISLCGCSNRNVSSDKVLVDKVNVSTTYDHTDYVSTTNVTTSPVVANNSYSDVVFDYFRKISDDLVSDYDSVNFLDKSKKYFVFCVDFLFYDGEIDGVRFSDMTDMCKQQLLSDIVTIDRLICSKFPNYKDVIGDCNDSVYNFAYSLIVRGSQNISDFSRDKLGEENYLKMREYNSMFWDTTFSDWDLFKDIIGSGYDNGKQKVKSWYESFRKNEGQ